MDAQEDGSAKKHTLYWPADEKHYVISEGRLDELGNLSFGASVLLTISGSGLSFILTTLYNTTEIHQGWLLLVAAMVVLTGAGAGYVFWKRSNLVASIKRSYKPKKVREIEDSTNNGPTNDPGKKWRNNLGRPLTLPDWRR